MRGLRNHSAVRPDSVLVIQPSDGSLEGQADLVACCHCGRHWPVGASIGLILGGKLKLGYCSRCDGICCPGCDRCVPLEQQLDNLERGRPLLHRPVMA